jgi:methylenetetrahydrofolate dehydrogenase (NADP+)/methenyltetrahydrofolate cyclohydrolase
VVLDAIDPDKDVDGFHVVNAGRLAVGLPGMVPCTPLGCIMLLRPTLGDLSGLNAVIVGRSNIVGKPMAQLLLAENCTVTIAHSRTRDLPALCRTADIWSPPSAGPRWCAATGSSRAPRSSTSASTACPRADPVKAAEGKTRVVGDVAFDEAAAVAGAHHPGTRRGRPDDHRLPAGQHLYGRLPRVACTPEPLDA